MYGTIFDMYAVDNWTYTNAPQRQSQKLTDLHARQTS